MCSPSCWDTFALLMSAQTAQAGCIIHRHSVHYGWFSILKPDRGHSRLDPGGWRFDNIMLPIFGLVVARVMAILCCLAARLWSRQLSPLSGTMSCLGPQIDLSRCTVFSSGSAVGSLFSWLVFYQYDADRQLRAELIARIIAGTSS